MRSALPRDLVMGTNILQQAHPRTGRLTSRASGGSDARRQRHRPFQALRLDGDGRSQDGWRRGHRLRPRRESLRARPGLLVDHGEPCRRRERRRTARAARDGPQDAQGKRRAAQDGKWADIALLEPVRDYKARHASTMLTFDAVVDAIGQIEAKANQPAAALGVNHFCHSPMRNCASWMRASSAGPESILTIVVTHSAVCNCTSKLALRGPGMRAPIPDLLQPAIRRRRRTRWSEPRLRPSWSISPRPGVAFAAANEAILRRLGRYPRRPALTHCPGQHVGNCVGRHEIGQPQFLARHTPVFPRRHVQRQRQQIAGATHVESVFGETANVALEQ